MNSPKIKTKMEEAAGKLVSAIQKEWNKEIGESSSDNSLDVMDLAHDFLRAKSAENMRNILESKTIKQYLGIGWVEDHPSVQPYIDKLEQAIYNE